MPHRTLCPYVSDYLSSSYWIVHSNYCVLGLLLVRVRVAVVLCIWPSPALGGFWFRADD